jgi:hypothetical protein
MSNVVQFKKKINPNDYKKISEKDVQKYLNIAAMNARKDLSIPPIKKMAELCQYTENKARRIHEILLSDNDIVIVKVKGINKTFIAETMNLVKNN